MRNGLILFIVIWQAGLLQAQPVNFIESYYPSIRRAENAITYLSFQEASAYYKQAFGAVKQPFAIDYYNAALCAIQQQDFREAARYAELLIDKGLDSSFFQKPVFSALRKDKVWKKVMKSYARRRQAYLARIDTTLRKELLSLNEKDQYFRKMPGSYKVHGNTIRSIDHLNIERLQQIIAQHGFPDENLVGIVDNNFLQSLPFIIILHRYQNTYYDLSAILFEQVKLGKLSSREFVQYEEYLLENKYKDMLFTKLDTTLVVEHLFKPADIAKSDQQRMAVGLEPIKEWRRKILFEENERLLLPFERYKSFQNEGFHFQAGYGVFGFIGDGAFNKKFLQQVPPEAILDKEGLAKENIKKVMW